MSISMVGRMVHWVSMRISCFKKYIDEFLDDTNTLDFGLR
jgi:hypothetical protein